MFCFWRGAIRRQHTSHGSMLAEVWWRTCCQHTSATRADYSCLVPLGILPQLCSYSAQALCSQAENAISKKFTAKQARQEREKKPQAKTEVEFDKWQAIGCA